MKKSLIIIIISCVMCSCKHKVKYAGHVYSKNNYPVSKAHVAIRYSYRSYSDGGILETETDVNGYFKIDTKLGRSSSVSDIHVTSDSGSYNSSLGPNNSDLKIDLK